MDYVFWALGPTETSHYWGPMTKWTAYWQNVFEISILHEIFSFFGS